MNITIFYMTNLKIKNSENLGCCSKKKKKKKKKMKEATRGLL